MNTGVHARPRRSTNGAKSSGAIAKPKVPAVMCSDMPNALRSPLVRGGGMEGGATEATHHKYGPERPDVVREADQAQHDDGDGGAGDEQDAGPPAIGEISEAELGD